MKLPLSKGRNGVAKNVKPKRIEQYNRGVWECNQCRKELSFDAFCKIDKYWSGLDYMCKECSTKRRTKWKKDNWWKDRANDMNRRASINYLSGDDLELIWEKSGHKCYYCDIVLELIQGKGNVHFDHVIPGINNKRNLAITCFRCNTLKSNATAEELGRMAKKITEHEIAFV